MDHLDREILLDAAQAARTTMILEKNIPAAKKLSGVLEALNNRDMEHLDKKPADPLEEHANVALPPNVPNKNPQN